MRLAVYQGPGASGDVPANLATVRRVAAEAASQGVRLVVFPELFVTGYNLGPRLRELAEPRGGPSLAEVSGAAAAAGIAILVGFCERADERLFNGAALVERDGRQLAVHRKCHLYGATERALFTPGDALTLAELDGLRLGVLICYDVEFPEAARTLALAGAELIAVPTALMAPHDVVARARADACGREPDLRGVCQPHRTRGRPPLCRPDMYRGARRRRSRPRRVRRGDAAPGGSRCRRHRPRPRGAGLSSPPPPRPLRPTARPSSDPAMSGCTR